MTEETVLISVIIPAFNEEQGIGATLQDLLSRTDKNYEIIVVNDASSDQTGNIVSNFPSVRLITHHTNKGYGSALVTGMRHARGEFVIWFDSDGQHRAEDLVMIAETLQQDDLDYCIGIRGEDSHEVHSRKFGKCILRFFVRFAAGQQVQDFNSGLRGFRRKIIMRYLHLLPEGFGASTMTTLLMLERNHLGREVPIVVQERQGVSSIKPLRDGFRTLMIILRIVLLFKPLVFFSSIGFFLIAAGFIYGMVETFSARQGFPVFGALIIILGLQSLFFGLLNDQISLLRRERFDNQQ